MKTSGKGTFLKMEDGLIAEFEWWKDKTIVKEIRTRYDAWAAGKEKGYTQDQLNASIEELRKRRLSE
ncbi:hypothetical protein [Pseudobacter ginsenosidimutans]|uniref:Addiction module component n=1 Tax=Pseudobacter ginsenosidimutans TaxID=661488 RepID=A0A4Q7N3P9_9BACT|nr:hypothetical protein [Pseudobacter ginsenosidimutans]QEC44151.1 hypothetical protein FSB84_21635 [Pseudobacter ginsenosidimutans]RZS75599.1 hypothetical protein EV199_1468 [Pseudobacter ginsenosidimutans]